MPKGKNKKYILIIEDDLLLARMYKKKFELIENIEVDIASNGREGIEKAKEGYDMILLDILLPEIDGFDVLRTLKEDSTTRDIPVLILTQLGTSQILIQEGLKLGAEDYLVKSKVSSDEVVEKVKKILK